MVACLNFLMIKVPQSALASPDDKGEPVAPEVGDVVDLGGVQAKVQAIDGDNCTLAIESVNGAKCQDCDDDDGDVGDADTDDADSAETGLPLGKDGAALYAKAAAADKRAGRS